MDQYVLAHTHTIHFRDNDDKMTKAALNEARKDPESVYTQCYPAAACVVDAILTSGMEATIDVQMLYLPAHRHELITRKMSRARCPRETSEARDPPSVVATSADNKAPERLPDSAPTPAAPEVPPSVVVVLRGFVMKAWHDFSQLAFGKETLFFGICARVYRKLN
jgi:hypothetical protein